MFTVFRLPAPAARPSRAAVTAIAVVTAVAVLAGCGGDGERGETAEGETGEGGTPTSPNASATPNASASAEPSASSSVGALPDAYDFTPAPERIPRTAAQARALTRDVVLAPADWTPGMVRHDPYETAGTWPVLPDTCVWTRGKLPDGVLDSHNRRIDLPAKDGKGRVLGSGCTTSTTSLSSTTRASTDGR
ncbi:hypothetical protein [Streptomyces sp. AVP053U2]|uniref:hypothetical protein n=1 Tax=Streptomyces sp. AVP053U2 TaxID=1737066 RepID=UPI00086DF127|nr:hypothetical protein [Streptomyces sp. AVP053U2]ODA75637.1 hypothetical protein APS67_000200 [Streptomyces sp. AVP053U2]